MKFNWSKYRMLVKNNPVEAERYIKMCNGTLVEEDETLEQLQKRYVEKFGKNLSIRYKNNIDWIKNKLAE